MKIAITKEQMELISKTPPSECWICDHVFKHNRRRPDGSFIVNMLDDGMIEHIKQIIS